jgi:hypothetical protein
MRDRTAVAILAAPILAAGLLLPARAEANVSLGVACQGPTARVVLDGFAPGRAISGSLLVTLDGDTVHVGSHAFTGPTSLLTFRLPRGRGWLVAAYAVGTEQWSDAAAVECEGPVPALPPAPQTPPASSAPEPAAPAPRPPRTAEPPAARPTDCATLRLVGAGRRWLVRFGCVRPQPRITCAELIRRGAGPRWFWRLRCPMPLPPRPPAVHVPVTG